MSWSLKTFALAGCLAVAACGGAESHKKVDDAGVDKADMDGSVKGPDDTLAVGDMVDTDGDGIADGVVVDTDGDGVADGVDTNNDGVVDEPVPSGDAGSDAAVTSDASAPFPVNDAGMVMCGSAACACSDGKDNDMDGVSDLLDPECVSTWDNDEGSLATGIPGDNRDEACQDCFFDGNSGSGNDGCRIPTSCITLGNASSGHGSCNKCEQTAQCKNFCEAYTPNGCDCFGCCDVKVGSTVKHILLSAACSIDGETLTNCTECVPSTTCVNQCGRCELCAGKTVADLPADCTPPPATTDGGAPTGDSGTPSGDSGTPSGDGGTGNPPPPPAYTCDNGEQVCGAGLPGCAASYLCQFGCCTLSPIALF